MGSVAQGDDYCCVAVPNEIQSRYRHWLDAENLITVQGLTSVVRGIGWGLRVT